MPRDSVSRGPMPRGTMPRESVSRGLYHVVRCHVVSFLRGPVLNSHVILSLMCSLSNVL